MPINADKKFKDAIFKRTEDYKLKSVRDINEETELESILEKGAGHSYNLKIMKALYNVLNSYAEERIYENGLICLSVVIKYKKYDDINNIYTMRMTLITNDYNKAPFINIVETRDKKSIHQLLAESTPNSNIFPDAMKTIEIHSTTIRVNDNCGSVFKVYKNLNDNSLMAEKYKQYYPISDYNPSSSKDLLRLCGCGDRDLEIIYNNEKPIYAQLSKKYNVEMAGFDPNNAKDAEKIVNKINEEVDAITNVINSIFDEQEQKVKPNGHVKSLRKDN